MSFNQTSVNIHNLKAYEKFKQLEKDQCLPKIVVYRGKFLFVIPTKTSRSTRISKIKIIFQNLTSKFLVKTGVFSLKDPLIKPLIADAQKYVLTLAGNYEEGLNEKLTLLNDRVNTLKDQQQHYSASIDLVKKENEAYQEQKKILSADLTVLEKANSQLTEKNENVQNTLEIAEKQLSEQEQALKKIEKEISEKQSLHKEVIQTKTQLTDLKKELEITKKEISKNQAPVENKCHNCSSEGYWEGESAGYLRGLEEGRQEGISIGYAAVYSSQRL